MGSEAFLLIVAPLFAFVSGVLLIPKFIKPKQDKPNKTYKLIDELEKKYIY